VALFSGSLRQYYLVKERYFLFLIMSHLACFAAALSLPPSLSAEFFRMGWSMRDSYIYDIRAGVILRYLYSCG
jgi:hypothetical protein